MLPSPSGVTDPVVILRLRGHRKLGATVIEVLDTDADQLAAVDGCLYLSGVDEGARDLLRRTGKVELSDTVNIDLATPVVGESSRRAYDDATAWLVQRHPVGQPNANGEPDDA